MNAPIANRSLVIWSWATILTGTVGLLVGFIFLVPRGGATSATNAVIGIALLQLASGILARRDWPVALLVGTLTYAFQAVGYHSQSFAPFSMVGLHVDVSLQVPSGTLRINLLASALAILGAWLIARHRARAA